MLRIPKNLTIGVLMTLSASGITADAYAGYNGAMCQRDFENNWQETLSYAYNNCSGFVNSNLGGNKFYTSLKGARKYWEDSYDYYYLEAVDVFYSVTHGGAEPGRAVWAMWDEFEVASSDLMRLGNERRLLSIFSTYACETLKHDAIPTRYSNIMRGGLKYTTGSHDKIYVSITTDEAGHDYANNLADGDTIRYAWRDALTDWIVANDATAMTTGSTSQECSDRRSGMKYTNLSYYRRIRDGATAVYCWTYWNNL